MRTTVDFGIYLGAQNSAVAVYAGDRAQVIKNNDSMELTPCAVFIDKNSRLWVGKLAAQRLGVDPEDAYADFMLQMGTNSEFHFKSSGQIMKPEELTAEVFKALRRDVQQRLGEEIRAAVITVPAAYGLPQCDATQRAARLAGLEITPLLMEPTAAAMAYATPTQSDKAFWLVYDLGEGSFFDAAILQMSAGTFRMVNHAGDNNLGGRLIDWEIVDKALAPAAAKMFRLTNFTRGNEKWRTAFTKLRFAAEQAKLELSTQEAHWITIDYLCKDDTGEAVPFEYELKRSEVVQLVRPFIQRSVSISRQVLAASRLDASAIEKVILVGAATLLPYLREMLQDAQEGLGAPLDLSIDPLTVVVQGAAVFAGTQSLQAAASATLPDVVAQGTEAPVSVESLPPQPVPAQPVPVEPPALIKEAEENIKRSRAIVEKYGKAEDKQRLDPLEDEMRQAIQAGKLEQIRGKMDESDSLVVEVLRACADFWMSFFKLLEERQPFMKDQAQSSQLIVQGKHAIQANDLARLKIVVQQLLQLLPVEMPLFDIAM
jgi:molecular chaperone DnaK